MGVEVRIPRPGIPMHELRRQQPLRLNLTCPTNPPPRIGSLLLQPRNSILHSLVLSLLNHTSDLRISYRPQRRNRLHRAESHIEPGTGPAPITPQLLLQMPVEFLPAQRFPPIPLDERFLRKHRADPRPNLIRDPRPPTSPMLLIPRGIRTPQQVVELATGAVLEHPPQLRRLQRLLRFQPRF